MKENIKNYFLSHFREYFIISIIFLIGLIVGVMTINNSNNNQKEKIISYIDKSVVSLKEGSKIDSNKLFLEKLKENVVFILLCGILGSTVIGVPILYFLVAYRGFSLGYTISAVMATLKFRKGITFVLSSLVVQNIFFIASIFLITASGMNFCKYVISNKKRGEIKFEIIKYVIFLAISILLAVIAASMESYVSGNLINIFKKYL